MWTYSVAHLASWYIFLSTWRANFDTAYPIDRRHAIFYLFIYSNLISNTYTHTHTESFAVVKKKMMRTILETKNQMRKNYNLNFLFVIAIYLFWLFFKKTLTPSRSLTHSLSLLLPPNNKHTWHTEFLDFDTKEHMPHIYVFIKYSCVCERNTKS